MTNYSFYYYTANYYDPDERKNYLQCGFIPGTSLAEAGKILDDWFGNELTSLHLEPLEENVPIILPKEICENYIADKYPLSEPIQKEHE